MISTESEISHSKLIAFDLVVVACNTLGREHFVSIHFLTSKDGLDSEQ